MTTDAIIYETALDEPPELVWRVLTEPALVARWLGATDIRAVVGERFEVKPGGTAGDAPIACEVLEAEPDRLLSYRWRASGEGRAEALDTVVTWILEPTAEGGTRLRLVHDGFPIVVQQPAVATGSNKVIAMTQPRSAVGFRKNLDPRFRGEERRKRLPRPVPIKAQRSLAWAA